MSDQAPPETDDDDLIREIESRYKESTSHLEDWIEECKDLRKIAAGDQWPETDRAIRESGPRPRPTVEFNFVAAFLDAVVGLEINNRKEARYLPRNPGKAAANDLLTGAAEWARDEADAEDEETQAAIDMLTCGLGWVESGMDYMEEPDGMIEMARRDPLRMRYDPSASKRSLKDKRWVMCIEDTTLQELIDDYPDVNLEGCQLSGPWDADMDDLDGKVSPQRDISKVDAYRDPDTGQMPYNVATKTVRIVRYQRATTKPIIRVATQDGQIQEFDPDQFDMSIRPQLEMEGVPYKQIRQKRRVVEQISIVGRTILQRGIGPIEDMFTFSAMTGKYDNDKGTFYGLMRTLKAPQQWVNVLLSAIIEVFQTGPKGGLMAEVGAAAHGNPRKLEESWTDSTSVTWLAPGALSGGKVQEKPKVDYPNGMDRMIQFSMQSFYALTGMNPELVGAADRDQTGIVETQRKQSGITNLAWVFDSIRRYRKHNARVLAKLIIEYMADGRLVRIAGEEGAQYVPILKNDISFAYDTIVDEAPTSPSMKDRVFQILTQLIPTLQAMGVPMPPDLIKYMPLPEVLVEKWLSYIQEMAQQPNPQGDMMAAAAEEQKARAMAQQAKAYKDTTEAQQNELENQFLQSTGVKP